MIRAVWAYNNVFPEPVQENANHIIFTAETDFDLIATKHAKQLLAVLCHVKCAEFLRPKALTVRDISWFFCYPCFLPLMLDN